MRRRWLFPLLGLLLLVAAAWLMSLGDTEGERIERRVVSFPRYPKSEERARLRERSIPIPVPDTGTGDPPREPVRRDPVLAALPPGEGGTAMVIEANALVHSPIGQLLLGCLRRKGGRDFLGQIQEELGFDPLQDLDRIAFSGDNEDDDELMLLSGDFRDFGQEIPSGDERASYGRFGEIYTRSGEAAFATWNGQMLIVGDRVDALRAAIDRMEGRAPDRPPALGEEDAFGELYGKIGVSGLEKLLEGADPEFSAPILRAVNRVDLHLDAQNDVAMVASLRGIDAGQMRDLAKTLGSALSLARVGAYAKGERDLGELLDLASISPRGDGSFTAEIALPMAFLEKKLAFCREPGERAAGDDADSLPGTVP